MRLKDNLYNKVETKHGNGGETDTVRLNPECFIYKAHFPGNPVTPGVCIIQSACELLEEIVGRRLSITEIKDVKFLNILSPLTTPKVDFAFSDVDDNGLSVKAKIVVKAGDEVFTTISFVCE